MSSTLLFDEAARRSLQRGVNSLADVAKVTIGPGGRNVVIGNVEVGPKDGAFKKVRGGGMTVTGDGLLIARHIDMADPFENLGVQLVTEAAIRTKRATGNGATTAIVLAQAMLREGLRNVAAGADPVGLKKGMDAAVRTVCRYVGSVTRRVAGPEELAAVASLSAKDPEVGGLMVETMAKGGIITVEEGHTLGLHLEFNEGVKIDRGYLSPEMATDRVSAQSVLHHPHVLIHRGTISSVDSLRPLLERILQSGSGQPLLIIAGDVQGTALSALLANSARGIVTTVAVKAPGTGTQRDAILGDLATVTGATVVADETGTTLEKAELAMLGGARRVTVTNRDTTIVAGHGPARDIALRAGQIKAEAARKTLPHDRVDRDTLLERAANLAGGSCVIKVGAATHAERKERLARVENAVWATRSALEEGVVPGGGACLAQSAKALNSAPGRVDDRSIGIGVVRHALVEPLRRIAENAGHDGSVVASKVAESETGVGFDVLAGRYGNLLEAGIIDPAQAVRAALTHAASVVSLMLTTEVLVVDNHSEGGR
ncbi:molecular chaperone GroEL [Streptomyces sp. NPDC048636]|uniref:Hsp60 family chaperonin n=1 Tax=Streptomyces sp. NPDC048636 TaxID=3155762 RepID=UPI00343AB3A1